MRRTGQSVRQTPGGNSGRLKRSSPVCDVKAVNERGFLDECLYLQFTSIAVPGHIILDGENAIDGTSCTVITLPLLLEVGLEDNMSLWTQTESSLLLFLLLYSNVSVY